MPRKIRAVLDTNVIVSALLTRKPSPPKQIYEAIRAQKFILVASYSVLREIENVLKRPQLNICPQTWHAALRELKSRVAIVKYPPKTKAIKQDPADNKFLVPLQVNLVGIMALINAFVANIY